MEQLLLGIFLTLAIATVGSIVLKRFGISHIISYIFTGTIISHLFDFNGAHVDLLDLIGEFGIVLLMFTIGLELSLPRIKKMKELLLVNGALQVALSILAIFSIAFWAFGLGLNTALIIALAFSLSSTAIVMTYLKSSKDIVTPYGQKSMGILIFQDLAVIPILLLITFMAAPDLSIGEILFTTLISAAVILLFMFTLGAAIVNALLKFAAKTEQEELFLGAVFAIVIGTSLLAHGMGFTYSLGAFIAGVIIADTDFNVKVESDIMSYKDLLLGVFFFAVGTKIDLGFLLAHLHTIIAVFLLIVLVKSLVIYAIIRRNSDKNTSAKTALSLAQVGEFSFAVFTLAAAHELIDDPTAAFLILVSVISMILTPFIVQNIYKLSSFFEKEYWEADVITPIAKKDHIIVAGFSTLGRIVASELKTKGIDFVIISDNLRHVLLARKLGYMAYFGHLDKRPVLESLKVEEARSVIVTVKSDHAKHHIAEAVRNVSDSVGIILKIDNSEERKQLRDLERIGIVDASFEVSHLLIDKALSTHAAH
jgi:CPA2 family monovalent cation:H+ antiporter-2